MLENAEMFAPLDPHSFDLKEKQQLNQMSLLARLQGLKLQG